MSTQNVEYRLSLKDLFSSKIRKATKETNRLDKAVGRTGQTFRSFGSALGIGLGAAGIIQFGNSVVESLKNYEYFSSSLRTLMKGDATAAKALEGQLVSLAAVTPFSLVEVQDATKQLIAYGFAAGDVTKNINMLGDVAAALKIPFGDIAYLYGTLKTQGRAYTRDILQFTNRGIPIIGELAKQFGVSQTEIKGMVEEGKVGFAEVEKAFKTMTSEGGIFFNMMSEQSKTVGGRISNLGDNWEQLKVNIGKSQRGIIAGTVSFLDDMVGKVTTAMSRFNVMEEAFEKFGGKQFGFLDKILKGADYEKALMSMNFYDTMVGASEKSLKDAKEAEKSIVRAMGSVSQRFLDKKIGVGEFDRTMAIYKAAREAVKGNISLFGKTEKKTKPTGDGKGGTSSTLIEARGAQTFNIDIENLVRELTIKTENLKESASFIRAEIIKALVSAVNDFQLIATK